MHSATLLVTALSPPPRLPQLSAAASAARCLTRELKPRTGATPLRRMAQKRLATAAASSPQAVPWTCAAPSWRSRPPDTATPLVGGGADDERDDVVGRRRLRLGQALPVMQPSEPPTKGCEERAQQNGASPPTPSAASRGPLAPDPVPRQKLSPGHRRASLLWCLRLRLRSEPTRHPSSATATTQPLANSVRFYILQ